MTGDIDDFLKRLHATLPAEWFPDDPVVLNALLNGFAESGAKLYDLMRYANQQTRIKTSSGGWLDLIAGDFYSDLLRKSNESDGGFRGQILAALFTQGVTRAGMIDLLTRLTGRAPTIVEPTSIVDCGAYDFLYGYNVAGAYGSYQIPATAFITVYRPQTGNAANLAGYGTPAAAYNVASNARYLGVDDEIARTTDADILTAINRRKPKGTTVWVRITN